MCGRRGCCKFLSGSSEADAGPWAWRNRRSRLMRLKQRAITHPSIIDPLPEPERAANGCSSGKAVNGARRVVNQDGGPCFCWLVRRRPPALNPFLLPLTGDLGDLGDVRLGPAPLRSFSCCSPHTITYTTLSTHASSRFSLGALLLTSQYAAPAVIVFSPPLSCRPRVCSLDPTSLLRTCAAALPCRPTLPPPERPL